MPRYPSLYASIPIETPAFLGTHRGHSALALHGSRLLMPKFALHSNLRLGRRRDDRAPHDDVKPRRCRPLAH